jgi:PilZ domain
MALALKLDSAEGRTRDVSASGVFFTTQRPFSAGDPVRFALELEHADPAGVIQVTCEGEVVRVEPLPEVLGVAVRIRAYELSGPPGAVTP